MNKLIGTDESTESRTETGQQKVTARLPKTHQDYWRGKLKHRSYRDPSGNRIEIPEWQVRMFYRGREGWFNLATPNQAAAALKARNVYLSLISSGWDATIVTYKPGPLPKAETCTVGEFLEDVALRGHIKGRTLQIYSSCLRTIVSSIADVEAGLSKKAKKGKWDYAHGGSAEWRKKVDSQPLTILTTDTLTLWRNRFVNKASADPMLRKSAERTAGSYLRSARALFAPALLSVLKVKVAANPFAGLKIIVPRQERYHSEVDMVALVAAALSELKPNRIQLFIAFSLALWAGMRRKEADLLMWEQVNFETGQIHIRRTRWFSPKSEESIRLIDLPPEVIDLLRGYKERAASEFVLEGKEPNPEATYNYYRCDRMWDALIAWIRSKGICSAKAVHMLRKESGSYVASEHGIEAARQHLGHRDIRTTSGTYVEKKKRVEVHVGGPEQRKAAL